MHWPPLASLYGEGLNINPVADWMNWPIAWMIRMREGRSIFGVRRIRSRPVFDVGSNWPFTFSSLRFLNPSFLKTRVTRREILRHKKSIDSSATRTLANIYLAVSRLSVSGLITCVPHPFRRDPIVIHRYPSSPLFSEDDFMLIVDEKRPGYSFYLKLFHTHGSKPHFFLPTRWPYAIKQYRVRTHLCLISFSQSFHETPRPQLVLEWADNRSDSYYLGFEDIVVLNLMDSSSTAFPFFSFFRDHALSTLFRDLEANFGISHHDFFEPASMTWDHFLAVPRRVRLDFGPSKALADHLSFKVSLEWRVGDIRVTLGKFFLILIYYMVNTTFLFSLLYCFQIIGWGYIFRHSAILWRKLVSFC